MGDYEGLKDLLAEVLSELCNQFRPQDDDDRDYLNSLIERANTFGVDV